MKTYVNPEKKDWPEILGRQKTGAPGHIRKTVSDIIADVRNDGDAKVLEYTKILDGYDTDAHGLRVTAEEMDASEAAIPDDLKSAIKTAAENIRKFHSAQKTGDVVVETMPGVICRQKNVPIDNVGLYIPGGTAPLFSTVLMLAIPASIAGCRRIILCSPAGKEKET